MPFRRLFNRLILPVFLLSIGIDSAKPQDVLTYHNDVSRTGQNPSETILTSSNVNATSFGLLFTLTTDGLVDAQPLYASKVSTPGGIHNLLIVATENDTVYAYDADTGAVLWQVSMLGTGETAASVACSEIAPTIGVTATPVIDRTRGPNGAIYVVAMSQQSTNYIQRIHALDLATGTELFGGPQAIQAGYPGTGDNSSGGSVMFNPAQYKDRAALLLLNGVVYTTWSSHCDTRPYTSWVIGYNAATLTQASVLNLTPNGDEGGIWMSGSGPAADSAGNVYLMVGNGDFGASLNTNGFPANDDYGNAFVKLSTSAGLTVADYFEEYNQLTENNGDIDLGSGGVLLLPDMTDVFGNTRHLAVGAGKDGNIYVVNRDSMGKYTAGANNIYYEVIGQLPGGIWSAPAYFNGKLYYGSVGSPVSAFPFSYAELANMPVAQTSNTFRYPGTTPSISANGNGNGIVWADENTNPAVLHAYDATTLAELYNSTQAPNGRDNFGESNRFVTPTIANGKVYVGTTTGVGVFGLFDPPPSPPVLSPVPTGITTTAQSVTLSDSTPGATIYYTLNGAIPTTSSAVYSSAIPVGASTMINAMAAVGANVSTMASGLYTDQAPPPSNPAQWGGLGGRFIGKVGVGTDSNGLIEVFVRGTDNTLWHNAQTSAGGWTGWQGLGGWFLSDPVVARNADGRLEVFVIAADGSLWHMAQASAGSAGWGAWSGLGGALTADPAIGVNSDGRLEVLVAGSNGALWDISQTSPGSSTWSGWTSLGGVLTSDAGVIADSTGKLNAFVLGSDKTLWQISQTSPGGSWAGWSRVGDNTFNGDPVPALNASGQIEIFVNGGGALWYSVQTTPGGPWSGFTSLGGSIWDDPGVAMNSNGALEAFAVAIGGGLLHIWQTTPGGSWSGWAQLGGGLQPGTPGAAVNPGGLVTAFAQGTDGALYYITQTSPGSWN